MENAESDEHLRIFKCLVDTGADVLRNTIETKLLLKNTICFEQYLDSNKHKFYHQLHLRQPCCSGDPHSCSVNGIMDKKIFKKMYNQKTPTDTHQCLDRFETRQGITVEDLDLSDLNFFLWNSSTLSTQEENSLKAIMSTRSAICHPPSSQSFSINQLKSIWMSLENDILVFAVPFRYQKIVKREIRALRDNRLSTTDCAQIIQELRTALKVTNADLQNCVKDENKKTKIAINATMSDNENRVCQMVSQSKDIVAGKLDEVAKDNDKNFVRLMESNRKLMEGMQTVIGLLGKQDVKVVGNPELIEQLAEASAAQEIFITSEVNQTCLTVDKEKNAIANLPSEIHILPSNNNKSDASEKQTLQVIAKKVNSILIELRATPSVFKSVQMLKSAILILVQNIHNAAGIDEEIEDTVTVNLKFESPLTKDQIKVVKCLFMNETTGDNYAEEERISEQASLSYEVPKTMIQLENQLVQTELTTDRIKNMEIELYNMERGKRSTYKEVIKSKIELERKKIKLIRRNIDEEKLKIEFERKKIKLIRGKIELERKSIDEETLKIELERKKMDEEILKIKLIRRNMDKEQLKIKFIRRNMDKNKLKIKLIRRYMDEEKLKIALERRKIEFERKNMNDEKLKIELERKNIDKEKLKTQNLKDELEREKKKMYEETLKYLMLKNDMSRTQELEKSHAMRGKVYFPKLTDRRSQLVDKKPIRSPINTTMGSVVRRSKPKLISSHQNPYPRKN